MTQEPEDRSGQESELANQRRDLEREFDSKMRELKAQHKRQMDRLEQDRADWEATRKAQAKELADKAERVNRREDNRAAASDAKADDRKTVEELRLRVRELEERYLDAKTTIGRLNERLARSALAQAGAQNLLTVFVGLGLVYGALWLTIALQDGDRMSIGLAGIFLAVTAFLAVLRWRLRRTPAPPTRT